MSRSMQDRVTIRITTEIKDALDRLRGDPANRMTSRQDAFRYIVLEWLKDQGYLREEPNAMTAGDARAVIPVLAERRGNSNR